MPTTTELRAALEVAELEEALVAAKAGDTDSPEFRALKERLRDARRTHRELREQNPAATAAGGAVVTPAPLNVSTEVNL